MILGVAAQQPTATSGRANAPIDVTGYWVSVVTEDWMYRMVTPPRGDYAGIPLSAEGRRIADLWDPAKDMATGSECKSYGAAGLMRQPGRLHITWGNDNTLKVETTAGQQTRLVHFARSATPARKSNAQRPWQGSSAAEWQIYRERPPGGLGGPTSPGGDTPVGGAGAAALAPTTGRGAGVVRGGSLKVITTEMRPGYLRINGVPYSDSAILTEYFDRSAEPNGDIWLVVTTIVEDSQYLTQPFITSTHFKREPDGSKWNPRPCETVRAVRAR